MYWPSSKPTIPNLLGATIAAFILALIRARVETPGEIDWNLVMVRTVLVATFGLIILWLGDRVVNARRRSEDKRLGGGPDSN